MLSRKSPSSIRAPPVSLSWAWILLPPVQLPGRTCMCPVVYFLSLQFCWPQLVTSWRGSQLSGQGVGRGCITAKLCPNLCSATWRENLNHATSFLCVSLFLFVKRVWWNHLPHWIPGYVSPFIQADLREVPSTRVLPSSLGLPGPHCKEPVPVLIRSGPLYCLLLCGNKP